SRDDAARSSVARVLTRTKRPGPLTSSRFEFRATRCTTLKRMKRVVEWAQGFALALGGPGLFVIAFLDSSFLSFPEVIDLLVMGLVVHHKERMVYYALMPTIGSIVGCFVLYIVALKGGEAFLRKRFHERHVDRTLEVFQKYGLFAVALPSILPPPVPFK